MKSNGLSSTAHTVIRKATRQSAHAQFREGMVGFYHPRILVLHLDEKREGVLKATLETLLRGLK